MAAALLNLLQDRAQGNGLFRRNATAEDVTAGIDATGVTAIVTGASSGLGAETARVLCLRGAHVVIAVRNVQAGHATRQSILKDIPNARLDVLHLDLSSKASVTQFAADFRSLNLPLHLLINNAGVLRDAWHLSEDGIELHFATNHLGHFLLTKLLLDILKSTAQNSGREGRIVNVASVAHRCSYKNGILFDDINYKPRWWSCYKPYCQSKLANILHANELARRLQEEGCNITANSVHPGFVKTKLFRHSDVCLAAIFHWSASCFWKSVQQGASTICFIALHPSLNGVTGKYFESCEEVYTSQVAANFQLASQLWEFSDRLVA